MSSHPEAVVICLRATARQITTISIRHPTKKRSRNSPPLQPGNFRPFPIPLRQTFGRKKPRCRSLANCDHSHMPPSYKMVGNCHAAIAWHFPTIPAHLHANKRSKFTALLQPSASRQAPNGSDHHPDPPLTQGPDTTARAYRSSAYIEYLGPTAEASRSNVNSGQGIPRGTPNASSS